nr:unnamed protein product [Callosobruchus chinensis]
MADLEAVLADVSYLMAMEKSKCTPAARASKKIVLPDPRRSLLTPYSFEIALLWLVFKVGNFRHMGTMVVIFCLVYPLVNIKLTKFCLCFWSAEAAGLGHLPNHERGGGRPAKPEEDEVLEAVEEDPSTSLRAIEITTGVPKSTAHRILKRHELHPYHVQRVQTLLPADYQRRVNFSRTILERYRDDPFFLTKILWSDESTFKKDGYMNMHNYHEWHVENPHLTRQDRSQYRFKVNMWTEILNGQIIGPFELPDALNGEVYLDFLQNHLPSLLEDVPLNIRREMWFQQDGCPAHYAHSVREYLDEEFPGRWIGRSGPISWPARSPDLNPLDFFYWGAVKEKVYFKAIESEFELRERIAEAAEFVNNGRFARKIARSLLKRCRACIATEGRHFEHIL